MSLLRFLFYTANLDNCTSPASFVIIIYIPHLHIQLKTLLRTSSVCSMAYERHTDSQFKSSLTLSSNPLCCVLPISMDTVTELYNAETLG